MQDAIRNIKKKTKGCERLRCARPSKSHSTTLIYQIPQVVSQPLEVNCMPFRGEQPTQSAAEGITAALEFSTRTAVRL